MDQTYFTIEEKALVKQHISQLIAMLGSQVSSHDINTVHNIVKHGIEADYYKRDKHGINPVVRSLRTAVMLNQLIAPDRNMTIATMVYNLTRLGCRGSTRSRQQLKTTTSTSSCSPLPRT